MTAHRSPRLRNKGFSLIEILIAVVVLATGLLALTALQGSLTKASAEAKVRGRVAAFVAGRMESLRNGPYDSIAAGSDTCASTVAPDWVPASVCTDAAIGSFSVTQTVATWSGATTFAATGPVSDPRAAQFKRVTLTATWTDANGSSHSLRGVSDISPLGMVSNLMVPPDSDTSGGGAPIVREDNPVTAGMIPVALGDGSSSAASNPKPELKQDGQNQRIVGTKFNMLNYIAGGAGSAVIQKRFENEIVRCKCSMGSGETDTNSIFYTAQWPAIWTGDRYDVYVPTPASTAAPGQSVTSGPTNGVAQSDLCTQCCRDHHDGTSGAKYDPERTMTTGESTGREKYSRNSMGQYVISTSNYIQACRVIRVDGFWRVAADTYSRHFGLLETTPVSSVDARSGIPTTAAKDAYSTFVKDYAAGYQTTLATDLGTAPTNADALFDDNARGLNADPIVVATPNVNNDWRYLHGRGLYVDYLEADARKRIKDILADNDNDGACPPSKPKYDCILPYLPFTTINMTEIAKWLAEDDHILQVNTSNLMSSNPSEPFGGRTKGIAQGDSLNTGSTRTSNSGLAVYAQVRDIDNDGTPDVVTREEFGVDPLDDTTLLDDAQAFEVGTGAGNNGLSFYLRVAGTGLSKTARYALGTDQDDCTTPATGDIRCVTHATAAPMAGTFTLQNYWIEGTTSASLPTASCTNLENGNQSPPANLTVNNKPYLNNLQVTGVTVVSGTGVVNSAMPVAANGATDGKTSETTTVAFSNASADAVFQVQFTTQGNVTGATVAACTVSKSGNTWSMSVSQWNKPWEN
ncbi:prepilin-type N-terminal cleavage/methylation domain-containing protein [Lysobacter niabensis]|uniref:Prepilin-type N-terminal cleavage/methylation domain-containing protein n=1 Tax=Agrilutibacter niabensis TaxID=380628 RepID=A0ABU1VKU4_9GAMM|nr:prepilin-type N-terminal cleavage/methylation domain-containing protein [Lysobacter niabensis]MDR7098095.1 prepilin-type N-terminal cleavage/methylation domain-containing protein [Lysobacter niabensis]